jgi:hypothetical protein
MTFIHLKGGERLGSKMSDVTKFMEAELFSWAKTQGRRVISLGVPW